MSVERRKRLQLAIDYLALKKVMACRSDSNVKCCFCDCAIAIGQRYRNASALRAHEICFDSVSSDLKKSGDR